MARCDEEIETRKMAIIVFLCHFQVVSFSSLSLIKLDASIAIASCTRRTIRNINRFQWWAERIYHFVYTHIWCWNAVFNHCTSQAKKKNIWWKKAYTKQQLKTPSLGRRRKKKFTTEMSMVRTFKCYCLFNCLQKVAHTNNIRLCNEEEITTKTKTSRQCQILPSIRFFFI